MLQASGSSACVHSIDYPSGSNATLVHNDVEPYNFVMPCTGMLKANDFNRSVLLRWNITSSEMCRFQQWRIGGSEGISINSPPETLLSNPTTLSEKVDVFALGTMIFEFLTSRRLYEEEIGQLRSSEEPLDTKIISLVTSPVQPSLPKDIENSSDSTIVGLKVVIRQALQYRVEDLPTMQEIVNQLKRLYISPKQQNIVQKSIRLKLSYFWSKN